MVENNRIIPKRALGEGRWDRVLKQKMVELSVSDDYDVAKHEWIATGKVWWDEVGSSEPGYTNGHPYYCLCGLSGWKSSFLWTCHESSFSHIQLLDPEGPLYEYLEIWHLVLKGTSSAF